MKFKHFSQLEMTDCGPACLQMILAYHGKVFSLQELRDKCNITRMGVTLKDIKTGSAHLGLDSVIGKVSTKQLIEMPLPCILHWNQEHFVVLYNIESKGNRFIYHLADPGFGKIKLQAKEFEQHWKGEEQEGIAMFFEKSSTFDLVAPEKKINSKLTTSWLFLKFHLQNQRSKIIAISVLLLLSAVISWIFPVLLRRLIDKGVGPKNMNIVIAVLVTQFALFFGQLLIEWARSVISAYFSTHLSINIISEFIKKLIKLPIKFFDTRLYTDILQKIDDHSHIEGFITNMLLQFVFAFVSFIFLSGLLAYYSGPVFLITLLLSVLSILWIVLFLKRRQFLDYARFRIRSDNRNVLYETILGMPEVKINNAQELRFDTIKEYQKRLFGLNIRATNLFQMQQIGVQSISQLKNIVITFLCAYWVIHNKMSLGMMVSIGYIVGQLNAPLDSFVSFFRSAQDAIIAFNRLDEIQQKDNEVNSSMITYPEKLTMGIEIANVSFKYEGSQNPRVLNNISLKIPAGKTTAIVGASGSGKTTLMKLLLNFYSPQEGLINVDGTNLKLVNPDYWRSKCGVVLQDGYIYSGTIGENIALSEKNPSLEALKKAAELACILDYIESLPLGFNTKIGKTGVDISGGQRQRILIARAIFKQPGIIFFDEATNSLDATNERDITNNLSSFFNNKTVVVIAHRLSTVKTADQIVVLENGKVAEIGNHETLTELRGRYYELVKNQLELGS